MINFDTGNLSEEEIDGIFEALPVDISFVGKDDTVRYFNKLQGRIFKRAKVVIGKQVQKCHPEKSLAKVVQIIEDFKAGKRNVAEFWIHMGERFVYIRYFAVKNRKGEYLGTLEVSQDITKIKKIELVI